MPCIYDGLQQTPGSGPLPTSQQTQPGKEMKNLEDMIQPVPEPFKATSAAVNHNNNSINVVHSPHSQHRRNVSSASITANCYLQMLTSPLKTYRERRANNNLVEAVAVTDESKGDQSGQTNEKSNFQKDMETVLELFGAVGYAIYAITVSLFVSLIPRRFRYKDITDQVVLVTGAGSGIGRLMAKKLALNHGAVIVAWDINKTGTCTLVCPKLIIDIDLPISLPVSYFFYQDISLMK